MHFAHRLAGVVLAVAAMAGMAQAQTSPFAQSSKNLLMYNGRLPSNDHFVSLTVDSNLGANYQLVFPTSAPSVNQLLRVKAISGINDTLQWASAATGAGTTFQVAFWNGSSTLSGSNNLWWDSTNFRLGIGTSTPNVSLEVAGTAGTPNIRFTSLSGTAKSSAPSGFDRLVLSNSTGDLDEATLSATVSGTTWLRAGNSGTTPGTDFVGTFDNQALIFKTNATVGTASQRMRLANADSLRFGVNGGAGTLPPASFVIGAAGWTAASTINNKTGTDLIVQSGPGTGTGSANGSIILQTPLVTATSGNSLQVETERVRIFNADTMSLGARGSGAASPNSSNFLVNAAGWIGASSSSDQPGTDLTLQAGPGTGSSKSNGMLIVKTPTVGGSSGVTLQVAAERARFMNGDTLRFGVNGAGAGAPPTAYTVGAAGYTAASSSADQHGTDLVLRSGSGTGTNVSNGNIIFSTPNARGASGTVVQSYSEAMRITPTSTLAIGTTSPSASAIVDMTSTSKGLLIPRMTTAQRAAISSPATGLLVYQTDSTAGFYCYNGSIWQPLYSPGTLVVKNKISDSSRTSTTTAADDGDFTFAMQSTETWLIDGMMVVTSTSTTPNFQFDFTVPSGSTVLIGSQGGDNSGTASHNYSSYLTSSGQASGTVTLDGSTPQVILFHGIVTTGNTAGNFTLQWAQATSNATATVMKAGSFVKATKVK